MNQFLWEFNATLQVCALDICQLLWCGNDASLQKQTDWCELDSKAILMKYKWYQTAMVCKIRVVESVSKNKKCQCHILYKTNSMGKTIILTYPRHFCPQAITEKGETIQFVEELLGNENVFA